MCTLKPTSKLILVIVEPLSLFCIHDLDVEQNAVLWTIEWKSPLRSSGTTVLRSLLPFFPPPLRCLARSFRAPGEIRGTQTAPRCDYASCFPTASFFNPWWSHRQTTYPSFGLWGFYCNCVAHPLFMDAGGTNPAAPEGDAVCVCVLWLCVFLVQKRRKHNKVWRQECAEGSGNIKGWMASKRLLSSNKSSAGKEPEDESYLKQQILCQ